MSLVQVQLETLQREFAELFDRAVRALPATGLDQDEVVFERRLVCRRGDQTCELPADWLADRDRLVNSVRATFDGRAALADGIQITVLRVNVIVDRQP